MTETNVTDETRWERVRRRGTRLARHRLGIDTRSLAAFRIAVGALLVADLVMRSRDLVAYYTDDGVLPRSALISHFSNPNSLSIHLVSGEAWVQAALFIVAGAFAVALLVGYRTRFVTVVSWVLLLSLQNRNPVILNGGDVLLRLVLFWAMFLPLGERWSVDARRRGGYRRFVAGVATAALLVQVFVMYGVNAVMKWSGDLWVSGDAIYYVFSLDQFTVFLGDVLAHYPAVLGAFDRLWLALLTVSALLLLLTGVRRAVLVALFMGMHVGMLLTMQLGLFPLIAVGALLPFLPGVVWDALGDHVERRGWDAALGGWPERLDDALPEISVTGVPETLGRVARKVRPVLIVSLLLLVVLWNVQTVGYAVVPNQADPVAYTTGLNQRHNMFAPNPPRVDGWYVVPGRLEDGSRVDALHGGNVTWERPPDLADTYPNARWRKYLVNLWRASYSGHRRYLAGYLCRRWNGDHENRMTEVTLYYMEQRTRIGAESEPIETVQLGHYTCPVSTDA